MSRSAVPSSSQVEMLLNYLGAKHFLATGHARTAHARDRTREAWQEIALKLNSDGSGCIKTWQQWAKYWKDKKAAAKKKASQVRMARLKTGGGGGEEIFLSAIEERIIEIMGGEGFAVGDRELEIDPFPCAVHLVTSTPVATSAEEQYIPLNLQEETLVDTPQSESILRDHIVQSIHVNTAPLQTEQSTPSILDVLPGPSSRVDVPLRIHPNVGELRNTPPPEIPHRSGQSVSSPPRRRRVLTARRRLNPRSPPSQRHSAMASLTERFIAIEEQRLENERKLIENQKTMVDLFLGVTRGIEKLCEATKALAETIHNKNN